MKKNTSLCLSCPSVCLMLRINSLQKTSCIQTTPSPHPNSVPLHMLPCRGSLFGYTALKRMYPTVNGTMVWFPRCLRTHNLPRYFPTLKKIHPLGRTCSANVDICSPFITWMKEHYQLIPSTACVACFELSTITICPRWFQTDSNINEYLYQSYILMKF